MSIANCSWVRATLPPWPCLRSFPSITYNQPRVQLSTILVEQALIQAHIPFGLIFDEHLADLAKYRVLVLPETECLSDAQLDSIRKFVAEGGGLVATGTAGLYDQCRRVRVRAGAARMVEYQFPARAYEEQVAALTAVGNPRGENSRKAGWPIFPAVEFDGPLPQFGSFFQVDARFWKAPRNGAGNCGVGALGRSEPNSRRGRRAGRRGVKPGRAARKPAADAPPGEL